LSLVGVCGDLLAEPFRRCRDGERQAIAAILENLTRIELAQAIAPAAGIVYPIDLEYGPAC
jgi:hypothetical protein